MLKFLTHKLRTHSLNEENVSEKVEERDSGTESDDEADRTDPGDFCADVIMKWNDVTDISMGGEACACAPSPSRLLPEPEPDHLYDHHSSEEELEVLSALSFYASGSYQRVIGASAHHKMHQVSVSNSVRTVTQVLNNDYFRRKYIHFPQSREERSNIKQGFYQKFGMPGVLGCIDGTHIAIVRPAEHEERFFNRKRYHSLNSQIVINGSERGVAGGACAGAESRRRGASSPPPAAPEKRKWPAPGYDSAPAPSSDDDDTKVETPVRFRTSPPREALKPRRGACPCPASPRRRRAPHAAHVAPHVPHVPHHPPHHAPRRDRPALDFDKMQQLKVGGGGVRSWRAVGGAGGELSVFCW